MIRFTEEVVTDLRFRRRYYLRTKWNKKTGLVVMTVRTERAGKGKALARVSFVRVLDDERDEKSLQEALRRLVKKWRKFYFVKYYPSWDLSKGAI